MKKINKNIFIIAFICAIITILLLQVDMIKFTKIINKVNTGAVDLMNKYNPSDLEVQDVEGYAIILTKGLGAFSQISTSLLLLILAAMNVLFILNTILYLILYLTSWLIVRRKENKSRVITSIILNIISIIIQTIIMWVLFSISKGKILIDVLMLLASISQLVAIITIIIYSIFNVKNIKNALSKKIESGEKV